MAERNREFTWDEKSRLRKAIENDDLDTIKRMTQSIDVNARIRVYVVTMFQLDLSPNNKTLTVCCYEALPIEEQAWKLHKQQEGVPVCKETTAFLLFRTSFITCYLIKLAYMVYWNLL
ncbi:uncharacterized protein [Dysidea avara]|uniref:uncharacterized protein n=1 Tax=Dysidea avara TaxID=196820 RepID=UPI00331EADAC